MTTFQSHLRSIISLMMLGFMSLSIVANDVTEANPGSFSYDLDNGRRVIITVINDDVIKVSNIDIKNGEKVPVSQSVILAPKDFEGETAEIGGKAVISTGKVMTSVDKQSGAVTIQADDITLFDNGKRDYDNNRRLIELRTLSQGSFHGAGERGFSFDLAGDTLVMYNKQNYGYKKTEERIKQMNISVPMFISADGYAVLFDDYAAAELIMGDPIKYVSETTEPISYYFIYGQTLAGVVGQYTDLTGRQELPPFWALGYITSKYGYKTAKETTGVIDTLKMNNYPVDGVVLDLYWYGKEEDMGRLAWEPEQWQDHTKMLSSLKKKGVNTVIISQPYVLKNGKAIDNYNELSPRGMFCRDAEGNTHDVTIWVGTGGMFDVSNPDTRQWLRDRYKLLTDEGVGGWWGDLGEPEVHPETIFHHNGLTARQYHNLYGNDWSRIIYDLYKEEYPETRLMTLMRGGTAGLQRYSVFPWSTDVSRSWGGLQPQVTIMLNSGLSGLGYMSHDVGGFAITEDKVVDPELYVRWLQLGTFSPVLRTHAQQVAEPYRYTDHQDIILNLVKTRYQWLPYNYTLASDITFKGYPMVRPLDFNSNNPQYAHIEDQYLWGENVMVAPVINQGATSRQVVIPEGNVWYDYNNSTVKYNAGTINYDAPLSVLPMFVKAGAVIPLADYKMNNTGDYRTDRYTLKYFPGADNTSYIYEDDRTSARAIEKGEYAFVTINTTSQQGVETVTLSNDGTYPGAPAKKQLTMVVYDLDKAPASVSVDGKQLGKKAVKYDAATRSAKFTFTWAVATPATISITR